LIRKIVLDTCTARH